MSNTQNNEKKVDPKVMNGMAQGSGMEKTLKDAHKVLHTPGSVPTQNGGSNMENVFSSIYSGN